MPSNDVQLRQFLRSLQHYIRTDTPLAESERALDNWAIIACEALYFERNDLVDLAIKLLHRAYVALPITGSALTEKRLAVVIRLYVLSSLAVRLSAWEIIRSVVQRPAKVHPADHDYVHSSWIRHGHAYAKTSAQTRRLRSVACVSSASALTHPCGT
jgi:hypothetical protein